MGPRVTGCAAAAASALLCACSGLSDVGDQPVTAPNVEAAAVNQPFTRDAGTGKITLTVRSGAEVVLSGKGSEGTVSPILKFTWASSNAAAQAVQVIRRNTNTVSFTAPEVTSSALLQFRLTVTDANDKTGSADVDVNVVALPDPNRFLSYLGAPLTFTVVPVTDVAIAPADMVGDTPVRITIARELTYTDLDGNPRTATLSSQTVDGSWFKAYGTGDGLGGGTSCGGFPNPRLSVSMPAIKADDIAALVQDSQPARALNPSTIDSATMRVTLSIAQTGSAGVSQLPANRTALLCVEDGGGQLLTQSAGGGFHAQQAGGTANQHTTNAVPAATVILDLTELVGASTVSADTAESADAYYATIDDAAGHQQKSTFLGWLKANGFVTQTAQTIVWNDVAAGAGAHAVYVNNFDLGFGRDMYARRFNCTANPPAPGQCDVAAVVVNYASLEGAAKKTNPIVAVAMEYTPAPQSNGQRIVKFYTFAPNITTGDFFRVRSVDLDRRGEKYMPGACTVCHGGTPGGALAAGAYPNGGDVQAGFLPWDLDSLLYSDTDGNFSTRAEDASLRSRFTRSAQEAQFKQLNTLAYLTYHDPTITTPNNMTLEQTGRFALARQLVEGWYGGAALPATSFSAFVPPEWAPNGPDGVVGGGDDNAPDSNTVYRDQFAKYCRSCHTLHTVPVDPTKRVNNSWDPRLSPACNSDTTLDTSATQHQVPMGCYRQFVRARNLAARLANAEMPLSRLSTDRLWVSGSSSPAAGDALINHLKQRFTSVQDTTSLDLLNKPGQPVARIARITGASSPPDIGDHIDADGTTSTGATAFAWTLERCVSGSTPAPVCRGTALAPVDETTLACTPAPDGVLTPNQSTASFVLGSASIYRLGLSVNAGASHTSQVMRVPRLEPCVTTTTSLGPTNISTAITLPFGNVVLLGNGTAANHKVSISSGTGSVPFTVSPAACAAVAGCDAAIVDNGAIVPTPISITPTQIGDGAVNLTVTDADGDSKVVPLTFTSKSSLTAQPRDLTTDANTNLAITIAGASASVGIEIEQQVCLDDNQLHDVCLVSANGTRAAIINPSDTGFTYRVPTNFSTQRKGDLTDRLSPETFRYRLRNKNNAADVSDFATITIRIRATGSFTEALAAFAPVCTACHGSSAPNYPGFPYTSNDNNQWRNGDISGTARARVNLDTPTESGLVCWPRRNCPTPPAIAMQHTLGGTRSADEIAPILRWIESGANNDVDPPPP